MGPDGQFILGGVVSTTVILNEQVERLPKSSAAMQLTMVSPIGKGNPDGGSQAMAGWESQVSVAATSNITGVPKGDVHSTARSLGQ